MWRYVGQRLLWMIFIIIGVAIVIFTIMYFCPGDPAELILGTTATQAELEAYREYLGLDKPYVVQLGNYLYDTFVKLDLGTSYTKKSTVVSEMIQRAPRTMTLSWICIFIDVVLGIPLGITCALKRNSIWDRGVMLVAMFGVAMPGFWVALMLVILFTRQLGWLPAYGIGTWKHWVMPVIAGSLGGIAMQGRQTRSAVLETVRADFVTTARAKGLPENTVTYKHMLPNAMMPIVGGLGGRFAGSIGGTVIIETVFSFPGVGTYMTSGITSRDYPVVRGCVLILAIFAAFVNLLVDIAYAFLDPRIKANYANIGKKRGAK